MKYYGKIENENDLIPKRYIFNTVADEYDATATYAVGDLCMHGEYMYKCITAITTAEAWDSSKWDAITMVEHVETKEPKISTASVSLPTASWTGTSSPYSQVITLDDVTSNSKVDLQPDYSTIGQMITDKTTAMYVENNDGTLTCYALGVKPTVDLTIQASVTEVNVPVASFAGLCFTANTAGSTVKLSVYGTTTLGQNFSYSTNATDWTAYVPGTTGDITLTNTGDKVYFKGNNPNGVTESDADYYYFEMTGSVAASGNIMSLIDNGTCTSMTIPNAGCFAYLFNGCESLTTPPALPATILTMGCYASMFSGCSNLTAAPSLPAMTVPVSGYQELFKDCTSLTTAPELPATNLDEGSYYCMFYGCSNLIVAPPSLPAETLGISTYYSMFAMCSSLTTPPSISATTLSTYSCSEMFVLCTSLAIVPSLHITTCLDDSCGAMFAMCSSLIVSDTSGTGYDKEWTIPYSGTFTSAATQNSMFTNCAVGAGRASDNLAATAGGSVTYYTQNEPV